MKIDQAGKAQTKPALWREIPGTFVINTLASYRLVRESLTYCAGVRARKMILRDRGGSYRSVIA